MILLLDPWTKFSVQYLIQHSKLECSKDGNDKEAREKGVIDDSTDRTIAAGKKMFVDEHREMFCVVNATSTSSANIPASTVSPNLNLIPCVDDDKVICGAAISMVTPETTPLSMLRDQADKVLQEWLQYTVD
ncbi:hypothetical protein PHPALM_28357 [Phytophthora palmivora]|uniref:Uncharacterized protein n=1 Tax=Phytophthora palmivora TaxID=4796 RepID=A0A2P4XAD3_9STRA|nr:hypothetical protein PHPALM_28357 [Phytophthora palmivora]